MMLQNHSDEDDHEAMDYNTNGDYYFDMIDNENARFAQRMRMLQQQMEEERHLHRQNLLHIWHSFGIDGKMRTRPLLTLKQKSLIRKRVRKWANKMRS